MVAIKKLMTRDMGADIKNCIIWILKTIYSKRFVVRNCIKAVVPVILLFAETQAMFYRWVWVDDNVRYNMLIYGAVLMFLILLPINWYIIYVLNGTLLFGTYYVTEFLISVRGRPFNYMDIFSVKEALRVSGNYALLFNDVVRDEILWAIDVIAVCCIAYRIHKKDNKIRGYRKTVVGGIGFAVSVLALMFTNIETSPVGWDEAQYVHDRGMIYATYCEYINSKQIVPDGYSKIAVNNIYKKIEDDFTDTANNNPSPDDIYVIMNESLADYSLIGDTNINGEPLTNIHGLTDNCFKGKCGVSVYGGNTANSEYEFLTGETLAFAPKQVVAYMLYDFNGHDTIVKDMNNLNYIPKAIHPYLAVEWKRPTIYEQFGFTDFISGERFSDTYIDDGENIFTVTQRNFGDDLEYIRGFISDNECYKRMNKEATNDKNFIFAITMQNHGAYLGTVGDIPYTDNRYMNEYLYSVNEGDKAFAKLLERLRNTDRKSVVLMFGDHLPSLRKANVFNEEPNMPYNADDYIVPYILWANYDIEWDAPEFTSVNYLSAILKKNCNIPLTEFDMVRLNAMKQYPVITANYVVDNEGEFHAPEDIMNDEVINDYAIVQYDRYTNN